MGQEVVSARMRTSAHAEGTTVEGEEPPHATVPARSAREGGCVSSFVPAKEAPALNTEKWTGRRFVLWPQPDLEMRAKDYPRKELAGSGACKRAPRAPHARLCASTRL